MRALLQVLGLTLLGACGQDKPEDSGAPPPVDSPPVDTGTSDPTDTGQTDPTDTSQTDPTDSTVPTDSTSPADPCGDPSVIPRFSAPAAPALTPVDGDPDHGSDNIYAPDVVRVSDTLCLMYYGGQGSNGHDQVFLATSTDCHTWVHWPDRDGPAPIVANGSANHVNDPSVVRFGGEWLLYYTVAQTGEDDRIHLATSTDGFTWSPQGRVLDVGPDGAWDDWKVGRPSAVVADGELRLYYDGNDGSNRHTGLATSADGRTFARHADNPLVLNAGAVDVDRVGDTWVLLHEGHSGTLALTSADGVAWCDQGQIFGLTGGDWDAYGQVTPFLYSRDGSSFDALLFGGASDACWCRNRIGLALPEGVPAPADPDAGCGGCVADSDCTQACRDGGYGVDGWCAAPGSTDPGACCACVGAGG